MSLDETDSTLVADDIMVSVVDSIPFAPAKQCLLKQNTSDDPDLQEVINVIMSGWPDERTKVPPSVRPYYEYKDELAVYDGIVFRGECVVIPKVMQPDMLKIIHEGHFGTCLCKRRARAVIFWLGMSSQIED